MTTPKKLSEIGTPHWQLYNLPSQEADYIKFTPAERRELVTQAIERWTRTQWFAAKDGIRDPRFALFEKFLVENGI